MSKICGIYKITSPSGKIYIGQSRDVRHRMSAYRRKRCMDQPRLYNSIVKYGWDAHNMEIIHECNESELNNLEAYYIKFYDTFDTENGLNLTSGGEAFRISEENRLKRSSNFKGKKHTPENKIILSLARKGTKHTKESIEKMRLCKLGKKLTDSAKEKLKIINTGKKRSNETKEKIRVSKMGNKIWLGKKHTDESRKKISEMRRIKNYAGSYEIYNQNNELVHKFHSNVRNELKKLNLSRHLFTNSYKNNTKIKKGTYKDWYMIKL
jgi:hypothetical protein